MTPPIERRREPRAAIRCAVKIYDPRSRRYAAGITRNISATGALVELTRPLSIPAGEAVGLAIDYTHRGVGVSHDDLSAATIARLDTDGETRLLGIRFVCPRPLAVAA